MQTWNLSSLIYLSESYWTLVVEQNCLQNPATGSSKAFLWISFKHWGFWRRSKGLEVLHLTCYNHVTTLVLLPKKKSKTMSANQAVKLWYGELLFTNCCCCCCCYGSCANDFKEENVDLTTKHPLRRCYRQSLEWSLWIQEFKKHRLIDSLGN